MLTPSFRLSIWLLVATFLVGTVGFMVIEGWTLLESVWMVVITMTTIGFGEIHPLSDAGRVFAIGLIVVGVGIATYTVGAVTQLVVEGRLQQALAERTRRRQMKALRNHYIVVGYGRLGQAVADELHASGAPLCVVERDREKAAAIVAHHRFPVVVGDGAADDVLREAGIDRAKGVAVAVDSSAQAVYVTLSARNLNPSITIVTRTDDHHESTKAGRAGASSTVSPYHMGGWRMAHELVRPHATTFLDLLIHAGYEDLALEEMRILPGSAASGKAIGSLGEHGALIVAIRHADGTMVTAPRGAAVVGDGDVVISIGPPDAVRRLADAIR